MHFLSSSLLFLFFFVIVDVFSPCCFYLINYFFFRLSELLFCLLLSSTVSFLNNYFAIFIFFLHSSLFFFSSTINLHISLTNLSSCILLFNFSRYCSCFSPLVSLPSRKTKQIIKNQSGITAKSVSFSTRLVIRTSTRYR